MRRRGLTMIELLLALALLGAIVSAVAAWTRAVAGMNDAAKPAQRRAIVEFALIRIEEDLLTGDFDARENSSGDAVARFSRVRVQTGSNSDELAIDLRHGVTHVYRVDEAVDAKRSLVLQERRQNESAIRHSSQDVVGFHCVLDRERGFLDVTINLAPVSAGEPEHSLVVMRRYRL